MSDLVGNPEDRFSHHEAHFSLFCKPIHIHDFHEYVISENKLPRKCYIDMLHIVLHSPVLPFRKINCLENDHDDKTVQINSCTKVGSQ